MKKNIMAIALARKQYQNKIIKSKKIYDRKRLTKSQLDGKVS